MGNSAITKSFNNYFTGIAKNQSVKILNSTKSFKNNVKSPLINAFPVSPIISQE